MMNSYSVVENANVITNGKFSVRWTGSKLAPEFVAMDIASGIGYSKTQAMYRKFDDFKYVDGNKGKGRTLMRSVSLADVEEILLINHKRLNEGRNAFREFWEDYVLPEFDSRWAKIASQKREIARKEAEISRLQEDNANLTAELANVNEKIISIKSLVA